MQMSMRNGVTPKVKLFKLTLTLTLTLTDTEGAVLTQDTEIYTLHGNNTTIAE